MRTTREPRAAPADVRLVRNAVVGLVLGLSLASSGAAFARRTSSTIEPSVLFVPVQRHFLAENAASRDPESDGTPVEKGPM